MKMVWNLRQIPRSLGNLEMCDHNGTWKSTWLSHGILSQIRKSVQAITLSQISLFACYPALFSVPLGEGQRPRPAEKMVGPRGWIFVIGLLVLTTGGDCLVNDACCVEDWEKFIAPVTKANTDHASDLKSAAFKKVIATWAADRDKMSDAELDDLCGGHIGGKCVGTKDKATCSCNKGHVVEDNKCVAEKAGDLCTQGPNSDHCKKGLTCVGTPVGECSAGGVDKTGVDGKGTASYTRRPIIMWVIIGGLALIPPASS